jgi:pimeloyl-ACP methyl ester carboxylesterase
VPVAGDAFVIPLPYGEDVDWLKNVLVAGWATVEAKGETYDVFEPEVIGAAEASPLLDERHRRTWRRFGIERFLSVKGIRRDLGAARWEELREFRAAHPSKRVAVAGVNWNYTASGEGEEAVLILPGGAMVGEAGFTRIPAFEDRYRVIAPSYAPVSTAAELLDGLAGVLDTEGVQAAHVLGPSYGGLVAQCFVRRHPERVRSLDTGEHAGAANELVVGLEGLPDGTTSRAGRMAADAQGAGAGTGLLGCAERTAGGPSVLARLSARAHLAPDKGGPARHVSARDRPRGELPLRAGRPGLLSGEDPNPGVGRGSRSTGEARRAKANIPSGSGAHVPRRWTYAVDEPQGGVSFYYEGFSRSIERQRT